MSPSSSLTKGPKRYCCHVKVWVKSFAFWSDMVCGHLFWFIAWFPYFLELSILEQFALYCFIKKSVWQKSSVIIRYTVFSCTKHIFTCSIFSNNFLTRGQYHRKNVFYILGHKCPCFPRTLPFSSWALLFRVQRQCSLNCPGLADMDCCQSYMGSVASVDLSSFFVLKKKSSHSLSHKGKCCCDIDLLLWKKQLWHRSTDIEGDSRGSRFKGNFIKPWTTQPGDNPDRTGKKPQEAGAGWKTQNHSLILCQEISVWSHIKSCPGFHQSNHYQKSVLIIRDSSDQASRWSLFCQIEFSQTDNKLRC